MQSDDLVIRIPGVESFAQSNFGAASTSFNISYPTVKAGNDLICHFQVDRDATFTYPSDWTLVDELSAGPVDVISSSIGFKKSDGTESGTFTVSTSASGVAAGIVLSIGAVAGDVPTGEDVGSVSPVASVNPDPPGINLNRSGNHNIVVIAMCAWADFSTTISAYPTGFASDRHTDNVGAVGGLGYALATRPAFNSSATNPGAFTISAAETWIAQTLALYGDEDPVTGNAFASSPALVR